MTMEAVCWTVLDGGTGFCLDFFGILFGFLWKFFFDFLVKFFGFPVKMIMTMEAVCWTVGGWDRMDGSVWVGCYQRERSGQVKTGLPQYGRESGKARKQERKQQRTSTRAVGWVPVYVHMFGNASVDVHPYRPYLIESTIIPPRGMSHLEGGMKN